MPLKPITYENSNTWLLQCNPKMPDEPKMAFKSMHQAKNIFVVLELAM
jgi:hypothetical protein